MPCPATISRYSGQLVVVSMICTASGADPLAARIFGRRGLSLSPSRGAQAVNASTCSSRSKPPHPTGTPSAGGAWALRSVKAPV